MRFCVTFVSLELELPTLFTSRRACLALIKEKERYLNQARENQKKKILFFPYVKRKETKCVTEQALLIIHKYSY